MIALRRPLWPSAWALVRLSLILRARAVRAGMTIVIASLRHRRALMLLSLLLGESRAWSHTAWSTRTTEVL